MPAGWCASANAALGSAYDGELAFGCWCGSGGDSSDCWPLDDSIDAELYACVGGAGAGGVGVAVWLGGEGDDGGEAVGCAAWVGDGDAPVVRTFGALFYSPVVPVLNCLGGLFVC